MNKILKKIFINNFKSIFYIIQNSKSNYLEFDKITFKLKKNSKLGKKNTYLSSRIDQIITPNIIRTGQWDYFIIKFIIKNLKRNKIKYSFFDIGANIGLITIQLYTKKLLGVKDFYCIEPEPTNFKILSENISSLNDKKIFKFNYALTNNKSCKKKNIFK